MSDIAISSRSCTERHGDFSESVVFHSSYEVSCFCLFFGWSFWLLLGFAVLCFCCFLVTPRFSFHLYSHRGNKQSKQKD